MSAKRLGPERCINIMYTGEIMKYRNLQIHTPARNFLREVLQVVSEVKTAAAYTFLAVRIASEGNQCATADLNVREVIHPVKKKKTVFKILQIVLCKYWIVPDILQITILTTVPSAGKRRPEMN